MTVEIRNKTTHIRVSAPAPQETEIFHRLSKDARQKLAQACLGQAGWLWESGRWEREWGLQDREKVFMPLCSIAIMRAASALVGSSGTITVGDAGTRYRATIPLQGGDVVTSTQSTPRAAALELFSLAYAESIKEREQPAERLGDGEKGTSLKKD